VSPRKALHAVAASWRDARLNQVSLGKYIVLFASLLHLAWAVLLLVSPTAGYSTPVAIITRVCGGPYRSAFVLATVAGVAMVFPFIRYRLTNRMMAALLIPQQLLLFMSAGAGLWAAVRETYADGVVRGWPFILSDQLPVILLALLYTVAVLEASAIGKNESEAR
jgi:hypothetical protein